MSIVMGRDRKRLPGVMIAFFLVLFLLFMGSTNNVDSTSPFEAHETLPERTEVTMSVGYEVSISGGKVVEMEVRSAIPLITYPKDTDMGFVMQEITDIRYSPDNAVISNHGENSISTWRVEHENGSFRFRVTVDAILNTHVWDIDSDDSGTVEDIPGFYDDLYLGKAWPVDLDKDGEIDLDDEKREIFRYDPTHPDIISLTEGLTKDTDNVYEKVRKVYEHIQDRFSITTHEQWLQDRAVYADYPKWASGCLSDGYGDNDDLSLLMASMLRSIGIPAWIELGFVYDVDSGDWTGNAHVNVVLPVKEDEGYVPVVAPIDIYHKEFLIRDPYRITDWIDDGSYYDVDGELVYNLDHYYNYFMVTRVPIVMVDIEYTLEAISFKESGSVELGEDGVESEAGFGIPALSPLLLSLSLILAIPVRRRFLKR